MMAVDAATVVAVLVAGSVGAVARYMLDASITRRLTSRYPWGTTTVNVAGSFVLGVVVGAVTAGTAPDGLRLVAGVGFCGGFTTFSTFAIETDALPGRLATVNVAATVAGCLVAAAAGLAAGGAA